MKDNLKSLKQRIFSAKRSLADISELGEDGGVEERENEDGVIVDLGSSQTVRVEIGAEVEEEKDEEEASENESLLENVKSLTESDQIQYAKIYPEEAVYHLDQKEKGILATAERMSHEDESMLHDKESSITVTVKGTVEGENETIVVAGVSALRDVVQEVIHENELKLKRETSFSNIMGVPPPPVKKPRKQGKK